MTKLSKSDFGRQYAQMDDDSLVRLSAQSMALVEEARESLEEELNKRHLTAAAPVMLSEESQSVFVASDQPNMAASSRMERNGAGVGRYIGLGTLLLILGVSMASTAFVLFSNINSSAEQAGESLGKGLIPWIVMITWARSIWRGISEREGIAGLQRRQRRFSMIAGTTFAALIIAGVGLGFWNAGRIARADRIHQISAQAADLIAKSQEMAQRLKEIRSRDTPTFDDYRAQCLKMESLLNDSAPVRARLRQMLMEVRSASEGDSKVNAVLDGDDAVFAKDEEIMTDLRKEIAESNTLMTLPPSKRSRFYSDWIVPLQKEEAQLAEEENSLQEKVREMGGTPARSN